MAHMRLCSYVCLFFFLRFKFVAISPASLPLSVTACYSLAATFDLFPLFNIHTIRSDVRIEIQTKCYHHVVTMATMTIRSNAHFRFMS